MLDHEQKNQTQPDEQQAECDPGDPYAEQNTHNRDPQRGPSTDRKIYVRDLYGTRFRRTSGNVSTARELAGIVRTQ